MWNWGTLDFVNMIRSVQGGQCRPYTEKLSQVGLMHLLQGLRYQEEIVMAVMSMLDNQRYRMQGGKCRPYTMELLKNT